MWNLHEPLFEALVSGVIYLAPAAVSSYHSARYKVWQRDEAGSLLLSKLKIYKIETKNWQDKEDEIKQIGVAAAAMPGLIIKVSVKQPSKICLKEM